MKGRIILPVILFLSAILTMQAQWTWQEAPASGDFYFVRFWENGHGVVAGPGIVLRTMNGGDDWTVTELPDMTGCHSFSFPMENRGYALDGLHWWKTTDGGNTWVSYSIKKDNRAWVLRSIGMRDADNGFIVGFWISPGGINQADVYRTFNGWTWQNCCESLSGFLERVRFQDPMRGFIASTNFNFYLTDDGGDSWHKLNLDIDLEVMDVHFVDENQGYLVASDFIENETRRAVMRSTDGGDTWKLIHRDTISGNYRSYRKVWFEDELNGYVVGTGGLISRTYDGGYTWDDAEVSPAKDFMDCFFQDIDNGIVVGKNAAIMTLGDLFSHNGVLGPDKEMVFISPNPCRDNACLTWFADRPGIWDIELFSVAGEEVLSLSEDILSSKICYKSIYVGSLPAGIYLLRLRNSDSEKIARLMVIH